ncbi:MAG: hypothetical protein EBV10_10670 [Synechococcaceae bacterium WB6_1A_059]|nr:hypothetical protein [Synechococcaceae bacterium WB6_1A_059]
MALIAASLFDLLNSLVRIIFLDGVGSRGFNLLLESMKLLVASEKISQVGVLLMRLGLFKLL